MEKIEESFSFYHLGVVEKNNTVDVSLNSPFQAVGFWIQCDFPRTVLVTSDIGIDGALEHSAFLELGNILATRTIESNQELMEDAITASTPRPIAESRARLIIKSGRIIELGNYCLKRQGISVPIHVFILGSEEEKEANA